MKSFKYKNKIYRYFYVKMSRAFKNNDRSRYPKSVTDKERTVSDIFIKILHDPTTELSYDISTKECRMKNERESLWIFLEPGNVKVINSVYGYDRRISAELEYYLEERFRHENHKRGAVMKAEALSKVDYSLNKTLDKINNLNK